jgi:hypothetical protein
MRRILIDRARRKATSKRGGGWERLNLDKLEIAAEADDETLLLLNESLEKLLKKKPKRLRLLSSVSLPGSRWNKPASFSDSQNERPSAIGRLRERGFMTP